MLAFVIFALTLLGILFRPFKLKIWVFSSAGAVVAVALQLVDFGDLRTIFSLIWDSALTLIALIVISFCLQSLGFFEWLIFYTLKIAGKVSFSGGLKATKKAQNLGENSIKNSQLLVKNSTENSQILIKNSTSNLQILTTNSATNSKILAENSALNSQNLVKNSIRNLSENSQNSVNLAQNLPQNLQKLAQFSLNSQNGVNLNQNSATNSQILTQNAQNSQLPNLTNTAENTNESTKIHANLSQIPTQNSQLSAHQKTLTIPAKTLFIALCTLTFFCTAVLANDGAILILTPLVLGLFLRARNATTAQLIAFLFATAFVCDSSSNALIISNLSNIITANYFALGFGEFARAMFLPNLLGFAAALLLFLLVFRKALRGKIAFRTPAAPKLKGRFFALYLALLLLFVASFFVSRHFALPLSANCAALALCLLLSVGVKSRKKALKCLKNAPFGIIVFSFGLFVVVFALANIGFQTQANALLSTLLQSELGAIFGVGFISTLGSGIFNNLPMVLFGDLMLGDFFANLANLAQNFKEFNAAQSAISQGFVAFGAQSADFAAATQNIAQNADFIAAQNALQNAEFFAADFPQKLIYAHLLGCNIGAKLTPIGSLCTLLWLSLLAKKGVKFGFKSYLKYSLLITIPVLCVALLGLVL